MEEKYSFYATFTKITDKVGLGVGDARNKFDAKYKHNCNRLYYWSDRHYNIAGDGWKKGIGYKVGERVKVIIDMDCGKIQWKVGNDVRHEDTLEMLKDKCIPWVPTFYLSSKDDIVELEECA